MNRDAQMRGYERIRRLRIPERFKDYRIALTEMKGFDDYDVIYDMPQRTIWVNVSAKPGANLAWVEPDR